MKNQPQALTLASVPVWLRDTIWQSDATTELRRLYESNQELLEILQNMVEMFKDVPTLEQNSFDEPPEPKTQWDYEAYLMIGAAHVVIAKAQGEIS